MIYEAIKHLKFRFGQDRITIGEKDISALNHIIRSFNLLQEKKAKEDTVFQKLFINEFLSQSIRNGKTGKDALNEIERLLKIPMEQFWWNLENETPYLKLAKKLKKIGYVDLYEYENEDEPIKIRGEKDEANNKKLVKENYEALADCLKTNVGFETLKSYLQEEMVRLKALYGND